MPLRNFVKSLYRNLGVYDTMHNSVRIGYNYLMSFDRFLLFYNFFFIKRRNFKAYVELNKSCDKSS